MILDFFKKHTPQPPPKVDLHSHLLPGLDDGVRTMDESMEIIEKFHAAGYRKLITTPHIMSDYFDNNRKIIYDRLEEVRSEIKKHRIQIDLHAAAEYYLDEAFIEKLNKNEPLLTFGDNYVLFETAFMNEPIFLKDAVFKMNTSGYKPVFAHPERYLYLARKPSLVQELLNMNVLFQLNILSLKNYYSKEVRKFAQKLLKLNSIRFAGSDCHNLQQFNSFQMALESREFSQINTSNLLNEKIE